MATHPLPRARGPMEMTRRQPNAYVAHSSVVPRHPCKRRQPVKFPRIPSVLATKQADFSLPWPHSVSLRQPSSPTTAGRKSPLSSTIIRGSLSGPMVSILIVPSCLVVVFILSFFLPAFHRTGAGVVVKTVGVCALPDMPIAHSLPQPMPQFLPLTQPLTQPLPQPLLQPLMQSLLHSLP